MTSIQKMALTSGVVFVALSALGFVVTGIAMPGMVEAGAQAPKLLGVFPLNVAHNVVHFAFGVWGLFAARSAGRALTYGLGSGVAYLLLAIIGLFAPTLFGMVPIGGWDIPLHLAVSVLLTGGSIWWLTRDEDEGAEQARKAA